MATGRPPPPALPRQACPHRRNAAGCGLLPPSRASPVVPASLRLDARGARHAAPARDFVADESPERLRRGSLGLEADAGEAPLRFRPVPNAAESRSEARRV